MVGVLIGVDGNGQRYLLRGVSGAFKGAATVNGAANAYWARALLQHWKIHSASRGVTTYGGYQNGKTQFGKCAAARILSYALHLRLKIESMAEIWVGATQNDRHDGQLQASCTFCREYLGKMLCDRGPQARGDPYPGAANDPPNRGLMITITEQPSAANTEPQTASLTLHSNPSPAGGTFLWTIANTGIANYNGRRDQQDLVIDSVAGGSTQVQVQYTQGGMQKTASLTLHIVSVRFQEGATVSMLLTQAAGVQVHANPSEPSGHFTWRISTPGTVGFPSDTNPGDTSVATLEPRAKGSVNVEVTYQLYNVTAMRTIQVKVT